MVKTLVEQYRQDSKSRTWEKMPDEMSVIELRQCSEDCNGETNRVQVLLHTWAMEPDRRQEVPESELSNMIEDVCILRGLAKTCEELLDAKEGETGRAVVDLMLAVDDTLLMYYDGAEELEQTLEHLREDLPKAYQARWDFWQAYPNGILPRRGSGIKAE